MSSGPTEEPELRALSARSVVLSLLLGAHPAELGAADLVRAGEQVGIAETSLRPALSRLVSAGDLVREDGRYGLSDRLLERQQRQDRALEAGSVHWDGTWELCAVTAVGRSPADRAELRGRLTALRLAQLREGLWMRPANLERSLPAWSDDLIVTFGSAVPDGHAGTLAARLWDLPGWAGEGRVLLDALASATAPRRRLTIGAAMVRHLLVDPVLPAELVPARWPSEALRRAYADYQVEVRRGWGAAR